MNYPQRRITAWRNTTLGKVPALVTEKGSIGSVKPSSRVYIELLDIAPAMLPRDPMAALKVRQLEALADGIMDAALVSVRRTGASGGATIGNGTAAPAGKNQPQHGYARKLSERRDAKTDTVEVGDYRDCACIAVKYLQLPPGRARLVLLAFTRLKLVERFQRESCPRAPGLTRIMS